MDVRTRRGGLPYRRVRRPPRAPSRGGAQNNAPEKKQQQLGAGATALRLRRRAAPALPPPPLPPPHIGPWSVGNPATSLVSSEHAFRGGAKRLLAVAIATPVI